MRLASTRLALCLALCPAWAAAAGWSPEVAFKVKRVSAVRVSPDGSRVAFVVGVAADGRREERVALPGARGAQRRLGLLCS